MAAYRNEQRRLVHRGRRFHFVSYDGRPADVARGQPGTHPTWYLLCAGKRWPVMPQVSGQEEPALEQDLIRWLDAHAFA
jgi:hypothetical protein